MKEKTITQCKMCGDRNWTMEDTKISKHIAQLKYHCHSCEHTWKVQILLREVTK